MKVVINSCFGGYSLSEKALIKLYKLRSKAVEVFEPKKYYGGSTGWEDDFKKDKKRSSVFKIIVRDGKILCTNSEVRDCPLLIKVVKEMGDKANGRCAELKIIEIPDGTEYEIEEYDGSEHVAEKHITWR